MHSFCVIDEHIYSASSLSRGKELLTIKFCPLDIVYMKLDDAISPYFSLLE